MALTKEIYCAHCGEKTGIMSRTRLEDGNYICSKCASIAPGYVRPWLSKYDMLLFECMEYFVKETAPRTKKQFWSTAEFHGLELDEKNRLFRFPLGLFKSSDCFPLECVTDMELYFDAKTFEKGMLGGKVTGDLKLSLKMVDPYFICETTLAKGLTARARENILGSRVSYDNPKGMDKFLDKFHAARNEAVTLAEEEGRKQVMQEMVRQWEQRQAEEAGLAEE